MIVVNELELTCSACPAQWEGRTNDGRWVYVRYRSGFLQVGVGDTLSEAVGSDAIIRKVGDGADGYMTYEELREVTRGLVDWPC